MWGKIILVFTILMVLTNCEYSQEELEIVRSLGSSLGIRSFTFLQNIQNVKLVEQLKIFPENSLYSVVMNSTELDSILSDVFKQTLFFEKKTIIVTKESVNFTTILQKFSGVRSITWAVFANYVTTLNSSYIPMNTNFFIVHYKSDNVTVNKAYHVKPGLELFKKKINISLKKTDSDKQFEVKRDHVINFGNAVLNMVYYSSPEKCKTMSIENVLNKIECFHQQIINIIGEKLNFTVNNIGCKNHEFAYNYPNGSSGELFIALDTGDADFSSGSFVVSPARLNHYDFAWPTFTLKSLLYIRFRSTTRGFQPYLKPMSVGVWTAMGFWILFTGTLAIVVDQLRSKTFKFKLGAVPQYIESILVSLQVFCNQGIHNISEMYFGRIVFSLTFVLFVALYESYSGFLISSLTVKIPLIPFTNFRGIFQDGSYRIMTIQERFHFFFVQSVFEEHEQDEAAFLYPQLPVNSEEGISKLCTERRLVYLEFRENIVQHDIPCQIVEIPRPLLTQTVGLGFPKHSPYKDIVNTEIEHFRSVGILHRMNRFLLSYIKIKEKEDISEQSSYIFISLIHVSAIFYILAAGIALSILIFILELYIYHNNPHKRIHKRKKHTIRANVFSIKYRLIISALEYFRSRSVLIVATNVIDLVPLQKKLQYDFYYCALTNFNNLGVVLQNKHQSVRQTVVVLDYNDKYAGFIQNETSRFNINWFITTTTLQQNHYEMFELPLYSEFLVADGEYNLTEIYDTQTGSKVYNRMGFIQNGEFFLTVPMDLFERRYNLQGATIKVVSPLIDPCAKKSFDVGIANVVWCIYQQLWEVFTDKLNAKTNTTIITNLTHDVITQTDAELTFRSAPLNSQDFDTRSFIWPVFNTKVDVVASYISQEVEWRTYILPFSREMWIAIMIWVTLSDVMLSGVEYVMHKNTKGGGYVRYYNECSYTAAYAFCSQGVSYQSKYIGTRILLLMIFIVPGVVFPGYSAILTSHLTVQLDTKPFRSLEELSKTNEYKLGWHKSFPVEYMFNTKDMSPLNQALLHNNVLPQDQHPETDMEAIRRLCDEKFVFVVFLPTVWALKPKCKYFKLEQYFKIFFTSIEIKKKSPYKYLLDRCERAIDYSGVLSRILKHTVMEYNFYKKPIVDSEVPPIEMNNIVLPFAILALGIIISVVLLFLERARFDLKFKKMNTIRCENFYYYN